MDGSSYLYRAFHALPDLRNPAGEPTGAIYGMISMLKKLRADYHAELPDTPILAACVFDAKGKTFRDELYAEYKAHRPPMPDDLAAQIAPIHQAVQALGWPILEIPGIEADDIIATLAEQASQQGVSTLISTGDKDLAQLVNDHVTLVNTMSGEILDKKGVMAKFGVPPERIVDYLTLVGDSVDNVPGVEKVGPKTAAKWLAQYGSLDNIIAHADEMKGVVGEHLRKALGWLPTARALVTVKRDCALPMRLQDLALRTADSAALRLFFQQKGFRTWLRELDSESPDSPTAPHSATAPQTSLVRHYQCVLHQAELDTWLQRLNNADITCLDTETTSLDPLQASLVGLSLSVESGHACYIPLAHDYPGAPVQLSRIEVLEQLRPWLESSAHKKVGQHLKYDQHVLQNHGITLRGIAHDTLLQSYVLEAHKTHNMDALAHRHLNEKTLTYEEVAGKGAAQIGFAEVSLDKATAYAAEDADITLRLHQTLWPQIEQDHKLRFIYQQIELPCALVLQRMERHGVLIDAAVLQQHSHTLGKRLLELEQHAYQIAGQPFNLNSPKQIGELFFDTLGLPVIKKTASGAPSTDEEVLQKLAEDYPLPKIILEHRGLSKLKSTYTDKLPRMINPHTGRVHTHYAQAVAVTGRLASNDPNLQNIPIRTAEGRRIREAFIAPPGHVIVSADYSQIELRIMAHLSGDPSLKRAFDEGQDVHRATAAEIFGVTPLEVSSEQRRYAKVINFGLIYGMSAYGLAANLGIEREAAKLYIDRYFQRYPGVAQYMEDTRRLAKAQGYVETVFGRRLWLAEIHSPNGPRRQAAERAAINAPMQGTAADLIKLSMIAVDAWLTREQRRSRLIMQVHDELVLEVPENEFAEVKQRVPQFMSQVAQQAGQPMSVPLIAEVGVGPNWEAAH